GGSASARPTSSWRWWPTPAASPRSRWWSSTRSSTCTTRRGSSPSSSSSPRSGRASSERRAARLAVTAVLEARALVRRYGQGRREIAALAGVDLAIAPEEFVAVVGPSGSGKSTLLHLLGALDRPSEGEVLFEGRSIASMSDDATSRLRRTRIEF